MSVSKMTMPLSDFINNQAEDTNIQHYIGKEKSEYRAAAQCFLLVVFCWVFPSLIKEDYY